MTPLREILRRDDADAAHGAVNKIAEAIGAYYVRQIEKNIEAIRVDLEAAGVSGDAARSQLQENARFMFEQTLAAIDELGAVDGPLVEWLMGLCADDHDAAMPAARTDGRDPA